MIRALAGQSLCRMRHNLGALCRAGYSTLSQCLTPRPFTANIYQKCHVYIRSRRIADLSSDVEVFAAHLIKGSAISLFDPADTPVSSRREKTTQVEPVRKPNVLAC